MGLPSIHNRISALLALLESPLGVIGFDCFDHLVDIRKPGGMVVTSVLENHRLVNGNGSLGTTTSNFTTIILRQRL